jgi:hypothetical protein
MQARSSDRALAASSPTGSSRDVCLPRRAFAMQARSSDRALAASSPTGSSLDVRSRALARLLCFS